jgi:flagellar biosynthetic protein FlhB
MAEDSDLERTEEPTGRRLEQAREQGQVPHSRELGSFLVLITAALSFWFLGGAFVRGLAQLIRRGLTWDGKLASEPQLALLRVADMVSDALSIFWPLVLVLMVAAIASPFFLNAWNFSLQAFQPKFERLDPINGIRRVFSWNGVAELLKAVLKALLIGGVAVLVIWSERNEVFGLVGQPLEEGLADAGHLMSWSFLAIVGSMLILVAADVPFQLWQYYDKLKMSRDEVRQEAKEMEGDPHIKARIRSLQREAARRRMMSAVPKADVIVTNPTHFAVALAYKSGMRAPKLVAKGTGEVALRIREIGSQHGVPMLEAPPLARALHRHVELDQEIPATLYTAVAEVLAYVFQLNRYRQVGGDLPLPPKELPVPPDMVPEVSNG